jgi:hypothetical protein
MNTLICITVFTKKLYGNLSFALLLINIYTDFDMVKEQLIKGILLK